MEWLFDLFVDLYDWLNSLNGGVAAVVGGLLLAAITGFAKWILFPTLRWLFRKVGKVLYPIASGAIILDRYVALPLYLKNLQRTVGHLRNPWLIEGQELKDIFIPLSATSKAFGSERTELKQVFETTDFAIFIGEPGSGKTTALKSLAMDCINKRFAASDNFVPVFIELRQFMNSGLSLDGYIIQSFQDYGFPKPQRLIKKLRKAGYLVFLLDALDEVDDKEKRAKVFTDIRKLITTEMQSSSPCRVFVTSRPVGYQGQLSDLVKKTLFMADFNPAQINKFINNWDFRPPKSQEKLINVIMDRPPILEICRNPLMLTIVTSLYRETDYQLPDSREDFYKICIDALLKRWDAVKELESRNKFPPALKESFLQSLAFDVLTDWTQTFSVPWVRGKIEAFLKDRKRDDIEPETFLDEVIRSGLLGRLDTGEIFFVHKTFAEALAASYLRNKPAAIIERWNKNPDAWIEVCSLYVADPLTSIDDIEVLIENAKTHNDWSGLLTLAGEAHTISDRQQEWIENSLIKQKKLWQKLDRRAFTALSRMKGGSQSLLTAMVERGSGTVRQEALYALGYSNTTWAINLMVRSLTEINLKETAITSLSTLGDRAIPILRDLIADQKENSSILIACFEIAEGIGSNAAMELVLPHIWSENHDVSLVASTVILNALNNNLFRQALESGQVPIIEPPNDSYELYQLRRWALPMSRTEMGFVESYYCKMIITLSEYIRIEKKQSIRLENFPPYLLIPMIILANRDLKPNSTKNLDGRVPFYSKMIRVQRIEYEIRTNSYEKNKALWARAKGEQRKDIEAGELGTRIFGWGSLLVILTPLIIAINVGKLTPLWLISLLPLIGFTIYYSIREKDIEGLNIPSIVGIVPGMLRYDFDVKNFDYWGVLICYLFSIGTAIYSSILLGGWWWLLLILSMVQLFFSNVEAGSEIIFWRRSNPLLSLLFDTSKD